MVKTLRQLEIEWGNSKCGRSSEQFIYDYFMNVIPTTKLAHYVLLQEENELLRHEIEGLRKEVETMIKERKVIIEENASLSLKLSLAKNDPNDENDQYW